MVGGRAMGARLLGQPAIWLLPIVFPLVMAFGGVLGYRGACRSRPFETGIARICDHSRAPMVAARGAPAAMDRGFFWLALFAIFHGYAHGRETAGWRRRGSRFAAGFVVATGTLHLSGHRVRDCWARQPAGRLAVARRQVRRIALTGAAYLGGFV